MSTQYTHPIPYLYIKMLQLVRWIERETVAFSVCAVLFCSYLLYCLYNCLWVPSPACIIEKKQMGKRESVKPFHQKTTFPFHRAASISHTHAKPCPIRSPEETKKPILFKVPTIFPEYWYDYRPSAYCNRYSLNIIPFFHIPTIHQQLVFLSSHHGQLVFLSL